MREKIMELQQRMNFTCELFELFHYLRIYRLSTKLFYQSIIINLTLDVPRSDHCRRIIIFVIPGTCTSVLQAIISNAINLTIILTVQLVWKVLVHYSFSIV